MIIMDEMKLIDKLGTQKLPILVFSLSQELRLQLKELESDSILSRRNLSKVILPIVLENKVLKQRRILIIGKF